MEISGDTLLFGLAWYAVFLFSTTLHEASHAFVALRLGDETAYLGGQVSLDPTPHIRREPLGMVVVPLVSFFLAGWMFGWASAPYDPVWAQRYPRRAAWMALGGPAANLALVLLAAVLVRIGMALNYLQPPDTVVFQRIVAPVEASGAGGLAVVLSITFTLNLLLFLFNLLPLPPLDGSAVVQLFMKDDLARRYQEFMRQPMIGMLGILVAWRVIGSLFWPILTLALRFLYPGIAYG